MWVKIHFNESERNQAILNAEKILKHYREHLISKSGTAQRKAINRFQKSLKSNKEKVKFEGH